MGYEYNHPVYKWFILWKQELEECSLYILEKGMAIHSSILPWRTPWTEEPGRLQSMGSHRVGHDWSDLAAKSRTRLSNWTELNWTVVLEKTLESLLDCKEIQPVHPKGNESWTFTGRTDAEAEAPILWPPDAKNWLIWKDPDAGKDWRWEGKGMTENEMVGWYYWRDGHEFK